jgi:hypothetical protein
MARAPHGVSLKEYITEEKLMASTLFQSIFEKGEARGEARGKAAQCAKTLVQVLTRWTGALDTAVATRIRAETSLDTLDAWLSEALYLQDAESARRLAEKIGKASLS